MVSFQVSLDLVKRRSHKRKFYTRIIHFTFKKNSDLSCSCFFLMDVMMKLASD